MRLDFGECGALQFQFFRSCLEDEFRVLDRRRDRLAGLDLPECRGDNGFIVAQQAKAFGNPILQRIKHVFRRIVDSHIVPGFGEGQRNPVTHEARADDGNPAARGHRSARRVPAVGIKYMSGVEVRSL